MERGADMTTLMNFILHLREQRRLTQEELARMIGVTGSMVAQYEAGTRSMSHDTLDKTVTALDLNAEDEATLRAAKKVTTAALSTRRRPRDEQDIAALARLVEQLGAEVARQHEADRIRERRDVALVARLDELSARIARLEQPEPPAPPATTPAAPRRSRKAR